MVSVEHEGGARLADFPIAFFAMVMGLAGLAIAWEKGRRVAGIALPVEQPLIVLAGLVFVSLLALYGYKAVRYPHAVLAELQHPVKLNFFPAISISLLLLSIALLASHIGVSRGLWIFGTALHLAFTLFVVNAWIHRQPFDIRHVNPAWFIPAVGNVLVPLAGVPLGHAEIAWFFFSVGMVFWLILMVIVFYRLLFHEPIDSRLMPTLCILVAPPAVGFIAYLRLAGDLDAFARVLYYAGLFLTLLLLTQVPRLARLDFYLSWWAYSFPLAAISISSLVMHEGTGLDFFAWLGGGLLLLLTLLVVALLLRTANAVRLRRICVSGH
jgi:tellurite resistance protein